mgnify:CR=1 FL=1
MKCIWNVSGISDAYQNVETSFCILLSTCIDIYCVNPRHKFSSHIEKSVVNEKIS